MFYETLDWVVKRFRSCCFLLWGGLCKNCDTFFYYLAKMLYRHLLHTKSWLGPTCFFSAPHGFMYTCLRKLDDGILYSMVLNSCTIHCVPFLGRVAALRCPTLRVDIKHTPTSHSQWSIKVNPAKWRYLKKKVMLTSMNIVSFFRCLMNMASKDRPLAVSNLYTNSVQHEHDWIDNWCFFFRILL